MIFRIFICILLPLLVYTGLFCKEGINSESLAILTQIQQASDNFKKVNARFSKGKPVRCEKRVLCRWLLNILLVRTVLLMYVPYPIDFYSFFSPDLRVKVRLLNYLSQA